MPDIHSCAHCCVEDSQTAIFIALRSVDVSIISTIFFNSSRKCITYVFAVLSILLQLISFIYTVYSGYNDIARDRKIYVGCRGNRYIRSKYKRKTPIGTKKNMSDVAKIVIPGVVITGVHCTSYKYLGHIITDSQSDSKDIL